jgi:RND family efflux transporter MFP subunit
VKIHILVPIAALVLTAGCRHEPDASKAEAPAMDLELVAVQSTALVSSFHAGGVVRARSTAAVSSRILAPVLQVHVRAGDRVKRGAPLVTLDGREITANRARAAAAFSGAVEAAHAAEADVRSAQAAVVLARATHERIRTLHDKRSATPQELDQARSSLDAAEAQLAGARARVAAATGAREAAGAASAAAGIATSYATLAAPFDGVVTTRSVDPGAMAAPGMPLLTIEDTSGFRLEVAVDEARAGHVTAGRAVDVTIGEDTVTGRVSEVARIDPAAHSFLVKVDLPVQGTKKTKGTESAPEGAYYRSGVYGRARFAGPERSGLSVPASAVVRRGQLTFVYLVDAAGRARLRPVNVGPEQAGRVEILAGARAKDLVVLDPPASLSDGTLVNGGRP